MLRKRQVGILLVAGIIGIAMAGCHTTPAVRVDALKSILETAQAHAYDMDAVVSQLELAAAQAQQILADVNLPAETRQKFQGDLATVQEQLAKYRPMQQALEEQVQQAQTLLNSAQGAGEKLELGDEIQTYGRLIGQTAGALPDPWQGYVALIGLLTTLIGTVVGALAQKKKDGAQIDQKDQELQTQTDQANQVVAGIVGSVNALLQSELVSNPDAAKQVLKNYQVANCPEARAAVRKVQGANV